MAIADLLQRAKESLSDDHEHDQADDVDFDVPDDLSGLEPAELEPDPRPRRRAAGKTPAAGRTPGRATAAQRKQVRENVDLFVDMLTLGWSFRDDYCPLVLSEHQEQIIEKMIPIIMRKPAWVEFLTGKDAALLEYIALGKALAPFGKAVFQHHVTHSVGERPGVSDAGHHHDTFDYPAPVYG